MLLSLPCSPVSYIHRMLPPINPCNHVFSFMLVLPLTMSFSCIRRGKAHTPHTKQVTLKALEWKDDPSFTNDLLSKAEPVLLLNSPAHSWDAIKWTPEYHHHFSLLPSPFSFLPSLFSLLPSSFYPPSLFKFDKA